MPIREETTSGEAYYGSGLVICEPGGCKDRTWKQLGNEFDGYDLEVMTPAMLARLRQIAETHAKTGHNVRVIIFEHGED